MVDPENVPRVLSDAARLLGTGRLVVFGSAALALRLERWEAHDQEHARLILASFPLTAGELRALADRAPYGRRITDAERVSRFRAHVAALQATL